LTRIKAGKVRRLILHAAQIWAQSAKGFAMLDIVMMAIGFAFFGLMIAYTVACDRL
jgi:hypothetical protein